MTNAFDIVSSQDTAKITPKGNVRIDYGKKGDINVNSVYTYNGKTEVTGADNQQQAALYMNNECYNVLADIIGSDNVLEEKDLDRIDEVAKKYKNSVKITKKLNEGEVTIDFKNGYSMTIDFETETEKQKTVSKQNLFSKLGEKAYMGLNVTGKWLTKTVDKTLDRLEQWLRTP